MAEADEVRKMIGEVRRLLHFHSLCGLDYPLSEDIRRFLRKKETRPAPPRPAGAPPRASAPPPRPAAAAAREEPAATAPSLQDLRQEVANCRRCPLAGGCRQPVFGEGCETPPVPLLVVCDPPGPEEDERKQTLSGESRDLFIKMIGAIGLDLGRVFVTNIVKCAPAGDRLLTRPETAACHSHLLRQIAALKPKVICTMGDLAARGLLKTDEGFFALRKQDASLLGIPVITSFHPRYLIREPQFKKAAWQDLKLILKKIS